MKFSRGAEEEADKLGVQYMYAAGYDPTAMATMFEKLESKNKKKPGFYFEAFASHPAPPDRRAAVAGAGRQVSRARRVCDQHFGVSASEGAAVETFQRPRFDRRCAAGSRRRRAGTTDAEATSADTGRSRLRHSGRRSSKAR